MARSARGEPILHPLGVPAQLDQNQQDYATQIVRAVALQSRAPAHLDPKVSLGIQLDDWTLPEFWSLRRGTRWQAYRSVPAVAGQKGFVQVIGSPGTLTVLEAVYVSTTAGATGFLYGMTASEAAVGGGGGGVLDDRQYSIAAPGCAVTFSNAVAPTSPNGGYLQVQAGVAASVPLGGGIVLTGKANPTGVIPAWKIVCNTVNQGFEVTLFYRERLILDSER